MGADEAQAHALRARALSPLPLPFLLQASAMLYLEAAELAGALLLFGRARRDAPAADGANDAWLAAFFVGSALTYCANCLTSAPYNALVLQQAPSAGPVDKSTLLLASQYGIFLGFLVGPLAMRGAMMLTATNQNVLAAVLVVGWALQAALNARVVVLARRHAAGEPADAVQLADFCLCSLDI